MSQLETNLNVPPFYDDYDANKKFYRILFVPSRSVQVRELNQMQTVIQEQIRRFGNHIFKDGSIVDGCNINYHARQSYVRLQNGWNVANTSANAFDKTLINFLVVSPVSGLRAVIKMVKQGYENLYPNTNTFYIDYINTGRNAANAEVKTFQSGELLNVYNPTQNKHDVTLDVNKLYNSINAFVENTLTLKTVVGHTYAVTVGEGIVYQKGYFVNVSTHTINVKDYSTEVVGMMVGFNTEESIVNHLQDGTLIDPSDTSNRNAPGADRLRLNPVLISVNPTTLSSEYEFFPIIEFGGDNKPITQKLEPEYAKLGDVFAMRTYEKSGDFFVKPFITSTQSTANTSEFNYTLSPGTYYVKGNRVELISTHYLKTKRATETEENNAQITTLNYGNYVVVDEVVGTFDFDTISTISIYDTPQVSITGLGGASSGAVGTLVGTANVRAIVYEAGAKGSSEGSYRLFLSNIKMLSNRSFTNDAKSFAIIGGAYGNAKADIVLSTGKAKIVDSGNSSLVFPMGVDGLKRLRSASGVNDTQFSLRDISQATLQANGSVTFTLNTPHAGGVERFFASPGVLSGVNELKVDIALSANALSANLAGTVNATTSGATNILTGTGTFFTTNFNVGEVIAINGNNRAITGISNNTSMTLASSLVVANTVANYGKGYLSGMPINMNFATLTVNSNTQFTVSLNTAILSGAPQMVTASYPVLRTQAVEAKKIVKKSRYVKIDCSTVPNAKEWGLGLTDVYKIEGVWAGTTYSENNPNRISWFSLANGQNESFYDHSKLTLKSSFKDNITSASRLLVKLSYFETDTTTGIGFYSVDSYPVINPGALANTTNISYAEIPTFNGMELRNAIDFRPKKFNTATDAITVAAATINPATANSSFIVSSSGAYLAEPDSNLQADLEVFLPRIDLLQVSSLGTFSVKSSTPDLNPKSPIVDADAAPIAEVYVPPYPSLTTNEQMNISSDQPKIRSSLKGNRVYTDQHIGVLDERLTRLEYYQQLSMLETQAKDFTVKDENGLDRFKNGIFVDPFNSHALGDVANFEYNVAIDPNSSIIRPPVIKTDIDLEINSSTGIKVQGSIASINYTSLKFISQPYATKFRNATESVWTWNGIVNLYPTYDHFRDEKFVPDVNVTIDLASPWERFANSPFGTNFGDWRVVASNTASSTTNASTSSANWTGTTTNSTSTTTTTTTNTLNQQIQSLNVGKSLTSYDLGSFVTDFSINPFMRSREVAVVVNGLKPSSNFWVFFDKQSVSKNCAPATPSSLYNPNTGKATITTGKESAILTRSGAWGSQLSSDSNGNLYALFLIPEGIFRIGDRELMVANVIDLIIGEDAIISSATTVYTASSTTVTKKDVAISTIEPIFSTNTRNNTRVTTATNVSQRITSTFAPNPWQDNDGENSNGSDTTWPGSDPLGQTFPIEVPGGIPGIFLDKIGVYFRTKDNNLGVTLIICEVTAGVPDTSKIISRSYLKPNAITVSSNSSVETVFDFEGLPYLSASKYYSFFLQPDGNSPEYEIWMSEVGGVDIITGNRIFTNPNIGVAVLSANSSSWNILQTEDIKFNIYRCNFSTLSAEIIFSEQKDEYLSVDGFNLANTSISVQVGDIVYTQNTTGGLLTANTAPYGVIQSIDTVNDFIVVDGSRGGFAANNTIQIHRPNSVGNVSAISANTRIATTQIKTINNVPYSMVVPRIGEVTPSGTSVEHSYKGSMLSTGVIEATWSTVTVDYEKEFVDNMRVVKSRSNKIDDLERNALIRSKLTTNNSYVSPIIDLRRRNMFVIENDINNDITDEQTRYGAAKVGYLSRPIVLAEGQDAEDIKVLISAYRPPETNVHVYAKFINAEDPTNFTDKVWTKLDIVEGSTMYSNTLDINDFREFGFSLPNAAAYDNAAWANQSNFNIIQYNDVGGSVYIGFKTFAIKIVLTSTRKERVPRVDDIRAIALQR